MQPLKKLFRRLFPAPPPPPPPPGIAADDPYATHIPVLIALSQLSPIRRVLELGSGLHSSPLFLDRAVFPQLTELHSAETDPAWAAEVARACAADQRFRPLLAPGTMAAMVATLPLADFDLIFIDDSLNAADRAATIRAVMARRPSGSVVAIHDYEQPEYQQAARGPAQRFVFDVFVPHVGILWDAAPLTSELLHTSREVVAAAATATNPADRAFWRELLRK